MMLERAYVFYRDEGDSNKSGKAIVFSIYKNHCKVADGGKAVIKTTNCNIKKSNWTYSRTNILCTK